MPHLASGTQPYADLIGQARLAPSKADILFAPMGDVWSSLKGLRSSSSLMREALKAESRVSASAKLPSETLPTSEAARRLFSQGSVVDPPIRFGVRL